jgi:hypothetical protein
VTWIEVSMTDPTADYPAELTQTHAAADTADETENGTGTLESAFAITSPSNSAAAYSRESF